MPTSAEGGLPEFKARRSTRCSRPRARRKAVVDKLAAALDKGLDDEAVRKRLIDLGAEITDKKRRGPKPLAAMVKSEIARLTPILKAAAAK